MNIMCLQCQAMKNLPPGADPHAYTWCTCCTVKGEDGEPHHHGRAAESCSGNGGIGHPGEPCPHPQPRACIVVSRPVPPEYGDAVTADTPGFRAAEEECPGGHCGPGVTGCAVCRPVMHLPSVGDLQLAPWGG
jgi:hypothetical protein